MPGPESEPTSKKEESAGDKFWNTYLSAASEEDKFLPASWEANTGGILTFTGLFAATVAAFLIESYKQLSPDTGDQTVLLLQQLLSASANTSAGVPVNAFTPESFHAAPTAIVVNALWFSSLLVSLVCALLSTLIQEWTRDYKRDTKWRRNLNESPRNRAFDHAYVRMGIERYRMDQVVYMVTALVHISVLLFAAGLVAFLFPINGIVAGIATAVLCTLLAVYAVASVLPLLDSSCPYRTPFTYLLARALWLFVHTFKIAVSRTLISEKLPLFEADVRNVTARRVAYHPYFLKPPRFAFMWARTAHHILHSDRRLPALLESLDDIGCDVWHYPGQLSCIWSDDAFMGGLFRMSLPANFVNMIHLDRPTLFLAAVALSKTLFVFDSKRSTFYARDPLRLKSFLRILYAVAKLVEVDEDTYNGLAAQLCLASVRVHLLQAWKLAEDQGIQIPPENRLFELLEGDTGRLNSDALATQAFHPAVFLLLMEYHATEEPILLDEYSLEYRLAQWRNKTGRSSWIPLHDDACCTSWKGIFLPDGREHIAASNNLTIVSSVLRAGPGEHYCLETFGLLKKRSYDLLTYVEVDYEVFGGPSNDFVEVLRCVGLEHWLQRGANFTSRSMPGSAQHRHLSEKTTWAMFDALKILAKNVNWPKYYTIREAETARLFLALPGAQSTLADEPMSDSAESESFPDVDEEGDEEGVPARPVEENEGESQASAVSAIDAVSSLVHADTQPASAGEASLSIDDATSDRLHSESPNSMIELRSIVVASDRDGTAHPSSGAESNNAQSKEIEGHKPVAARLTDEHDD